LRQWRLWLGRHAEVDWWLDQSPSGRLLGYVEPGLCPTRFAPDPVRQKKGYGLNEIFSEGWPMERGLRVFKFF
jgi:hypothetical protein